MKEQKAANQALAAANQAQAAANQEQKAANQAQAAVNEILLENTRPTKTVRTCKASCVTSEVRLKYLECAKVDLVAEMGRLRTYEIMEKSEKLFNEIRRYSTVMQRRLSLMQLAEKTYVQDEVKDVFWPNTRSVLRCNADVELVNERRFTVVLEDDYDRSTITGVTDHTIKMRRSDFHILTIEDKRVGLTLKGEHVAQAVCEMMEELRNMKTNLLYVPLEFCGILQNGVTWTFLFYKVESGHEMWNHVVAPDTFADGIVNEESCRIVARFLEHAFCVADDIAQYICTPKRSVVATSFADAADDGDGSDEEGEGSSVVSREGGSPKTATHTEDRSILKDVTKHQQPNQRNTRGGDGGNKKSVATVRDCDENLFLPFTVANVRKQPSQYYKFI